jgi:hypothetical protein
MPQMERSNLEIVAAYACLVERDSNRDRPSIQARTGKKVLSPAEMLDEMEQKSPDGLAHIELLRIEARGQGEDPVNMLMNAAQACLDGTRPMVLRPSKRTLLAALAIAAAILFLALMT